MLKCECCGTSDKDVIELTVGVTLIELRPGCPVMARGMSIMICKDRCLNYLKAGLMIKLQRVITEPIE